MVPCGIIQHPLDRFSSTKSMAGLDTIGRDAVDQLMTMIGDLQFCRHDIRGTCARYFCFVDTMWLSHLCFSAHIDYGSLQSYLRGIGHEGASGLDYAFAGAQMSFCFLENEDEPIGALKSSPGTQFEILCANNEQNDPHTGEWGPSIQKRPQKGIQPLDSERLGNG
jgi:hypothetical protein